MPKTPVKVLTEEQIKTQAKFVALGTEALVRIAHRLGPKAVEEWAQCNSSFAIELVLYESVFQPKFQKKGKLHD